jgi:hypothetical protein
MNRFAVMALVIVAAVAAVMVQRIYAVDSAPIATQPRAPSTVQPPAPTKLEGKVVAVEPAKQSKGPKFATVKLASGETVRASVPDGCIVFPDQWTRLSKSGEGGGSVYVVAENGRTR